MRGDGSKCARCYYHAQPMRRIGEPQEIINTMVLLCSPANSYMNGQAILIDGGVSAY
jgi:NAD(P)-dependent dehydrogenase (short-subunit alcohol dehydrogenase family)